MPSMKDKEQSLVDYWDKQWNSAQGREEWSKPDSWIVESLSKVEHPESKKALDLGAGAGRHSLALLRDGFDTYACDASETSVETVKRLTSPSGAFPKAFLCDMSSLPFENGFFDYLIAWNVIYHGDYQVLQKTLAEMSRVLKKGGVAQISLLSRRNVHHGQGRKLDAYTFMDVASGDKSHPHCYLNEDELESTLKDWKLTHISEHDHGNYPGSFHWHVRMEKAL